MIGYETVSASSAVPPNSAATRTVTLRAICVTVAGSSAQPLAAGAKSRAGAAVFTIIK